LLTNKPNTEASPQQPTPPADTAFGQPSGRTSAADDSFFLKPPSISLPKGGGAIRGIGEKFSANPVTGTASIALPIATSPARAGASLELSLSYDSGSGNSVFGLGWQLSAAAITRKTDKGLPQYQDSSASDVFILSGAEDLVPVLSSGGAPVEDRLTAPGYLIHRYRPRIEGPFARIERWTRIGDPTDVHWRSYSRDNTLTLYGRDGNSRITDPSDEQRIFSWLICEVRDDKGNAMLYGYKAEDATRVDLTRACEINRGDALSAQRTANRHLKWVRYGNRTSMLAADGSRPQWLTAAQLDAARWMFEVVFDYGEHDTLDPKPDDPGDWLCRDDPYSTYRAAFEVRTYRLCHRVLMFHHFPEEPGIGANCLVRSTKFEYQQTPVCAFLRAVTQSGHRRAAAGGYLTGSMPRLEFEYSHAVIGEDIVDVDADSLENLPVGAAGPPYLPIDLDGEGLTGLLCEQSHGWYYKRNESPLNREGLAPTWPVRFAPEERLTAIPRVSSLSDPRVKFLDLAGDGHVDLVEFEMPLCGFYERTAHEGWQPLRAFEAVPNVPWDDPNLRFIDLTGDGHADLLITDEQVFTWHASLAERGFGQAQRALLPVDEEGGPRVIFADSTESIFLSDISGDGLTDIVRIRNGEVCYWPNLGYGRFGARIAMDSAPNFDTSEDFDARRIRLVDIDGSGPTDIVYLGSSTTRFWYNESGNGWSTANELTVLPPIDNTTTVEAIDALGNGTAALVWSSPLPNATVAPMKVLSLMAEGKPHLLTLVRNNLGTETHIQYAPSSYFYVKDRAEGHPWITRLPFPVHVVERVETYDYVSRNRFVTRFAYHHGYFDGEEREFRGFGRVDQFDTEEFASLTDSGEFPVGDNVDATSHVPPVLTRTWYHTGVHFGRDRVSRLFSHEYYREPGLSDAQAHAMLLEDTFLPPDLTLQEEREASRALKGLMLRQETYADDSTPLAGIPYIVMEQNFKVRMLQPRGKNRNAVFLSHPNESLMHHYERNPADPRVTHTMTLEVDDAGLVLKTATIAYGRRTPDPIALPALADRDRQAQISIRYTENRETNAIDDANRYRLPQTCETRTFELTGYMPTGPAGRFRSSDFVAPDALDPKRLTHVFDVQVPYEGSPAGGRTRRCVERVRSLFRPDDMGMASGDPNALLPLGIMHSRAFAGERYRLAFTPGLLDQVYVRDGLPLLPTNPGTILGGTGSDRGGYVSSNSMKIAGAFPITDPDGCWWIPSGRVFSSPNVGDTAAQEFAYARAHFFVPLRFRDAFAQTTTLTLDAYDLLPVDSRDPVGNRVTLGERLPNGALDPTRPGNDYRLLHAVRTMDANRNRSQIACDVLGIVVGTAIMGKPEQTLGDTLVGFDPDLPELTALAYLANPFVNPQLILASATTRMVYDLFAYQRTRTAPRPQPIVVATLARETHASDPVPAGGLKIQHKFVYSDGFGREIQRKAQAEPGPVPMRDAAGVIMVDADGKPLMTAALVSPRWVGSGWTVYNNKGNAVRKFEPFFTDTHLFESDARIGVSPIFFFDPLERIVGTLNPDHTWQKTIPGPWMQESWDATDTLLTVNPAADPDVGAWFGRLPTSTYLPTWHARRIGGALGTDEQRAAAKAALLAASPIRSHSDPMGRTFLTVALNKAKYSDTPPASPPVETLHEVRTRHDIEGNVLESVDARHRVAMKYRYDVANRRIHEAGMDSGRRWMISDVEGQALYAWDSRNHRRRNEYDLLRRPARMLLVEGAGPERLVGRNVYGESQPSPEARNLRGNTVEAYDQAGVVTTDDFDFKGNRLVSRRRYARAYDTVIDWSGPVALFGETFTARNRFDAVNRPIQMVAPNTGLPGAPINLVQAQFDASNFLQRLDVWLDESTLPAGLLNPGTADVRAITDIEYDANGQHTRIAYGNGAVSAFTYDAATFRLRRLVTRRLDASFPDDCPSPPVAGWPGCGLQDLGYTYDAAGNIVSVNDAAQQAIYFRNKRVDASCEYTYDALSRLIEATGREHLGQMSAPVPHSYNDVPRVGLPHRGDGNALGRYVERYRYDLAGNISDMDHVGTDPSNPGWGRSFVCDENSQLDATVKGNRLTRTMLGATTEQYSLAGNGYDPHGNMLRMPQLQEVRWDFGDRLRMTQRQAVNASDADGIAHAGERTWYVYDGSGQRVRKVVELSPGVIKEERLYIGAFELYRRTGVNAVTRETFHVMDETRRVAIVDIRTDGSEPGVPRQLIRFQFHNHVQSVVLELDEQARVISYEEMTPYGSTSYQAVAGAIQVPKRFRFTAKERDEQTGLTYHGARYCAPWIGRWVSCDPAGLVDGPNLYAYARDNPVMYADPSGRQGVPQTKFEEFKHWLHQASEKVEAVEKKIDAAEAAVKEKVSAAGDYVKGAGKKWAEDITMGTFVAGVVYNSKDPKLIAAYEAQAKKKDLQLLESTLEAGTMTGTANAPSSTDKPIDRPSEVKLITDFALTVGPMLPGPKAPLSSVLRTEAKVGGAELSAASTELKTPVTTSAPDGVPVFSGSDVPLPPAYDRPVILRAPELKPEIKPNVLPSGDAPPSTIVLPEAEGTKTVGGGFYSPTMQSGWGVRTQIGDYNAAVEAWRYHQANGTPFRTHIFDMKGAPGSYYASHVEAKLLYTQPGIDFLEISKAPCCSCRSKLAQAAVDWDQTIVVHSPKGFQWFTPHGVRQ
jgi:RHS repeat-associated protein